MLDRDRRRVFNAQELVAFSLGFDLPIWWSFLPVPGTDDMRLEGTDGPATRLLSLLLGREQVAGVRMATERPEVDELLEGLVGAPSWKHLESTRLLANQELAWRESSTIETLVGSLREVVAKFGWCGQVVWRRLVRLTEDWAGPSSHMRVAEL